MYINRKYIPLDQKEFARKDYEGLTQEGKEELKKERSKLAKSMLNTRKKLEKELSNLTSKETRDALRKSMYNSQLKTLNIEKEQKRKLIKSKISLDKAKEVADKAKEATKKIAEESANNKVASEEVSKAAASTNKAASKNKVSKGIINLMRKNPKASIIGGLGLASIGGLIGYQHYKNKKKH